MDLFREQQNIIIINSSNEEKEEKVGKFCTSSQRHSGPNNNCCPKKETQITVEELNKYFNSRVQNLTTETKPKTIYQRLRHRQHDNLLRQQQKRVFGRRTSTPIRGFYVTKPRDDNQLMTYPSLLSCLRRSIVISAIFILFISIRSTYQQNFCPKTCTCDEENLEVLCKESIRASGIPHTLNPSTKRLIINNAQTSQFTGLDYLDKIETLDLAYNKLPWIDFDEISKNTNLISLNTSHNNIVELKDSLITAALPELISSTSSSSTNFDSIEPVGPKKKLIKINVIEFILNHNNLTVLRNFTFIRWSKLQRLDLSFNTITSLESQSLVGLQRLEMLNLRGNRLIQVPTLALQGTTQHLTTLPLSIQSNGGPSPMKYLDLSKNTLTTIEQDSFNMLEKAQELYLEFCSIQNIDEQAFKGLHTLYLLSLDGNNLKEVPSKSFSYIGFLRLLKINANKLTSLQPNSFSNLFHLEELQMNNGSFEELPQGVFNGLDGLKRLEIANNPNLTRINRGTFDNLSNLTYLSLYSNSIPSLYDSFSDHRQLHLLDLRGNPLYCSCDLKWLTKWLKKFNETTQQIQGNSRQNQQQNHYLYNNRPYLDDTQTLLLDSTLTNELLNLTCMGGPSALLGKPLIELPENKLECLEPSSDLNVHIGFAMLFFIMFMLTFVCLVNFCRNKKHLLVMLKENLVQNHISMMLPYSQNLHKNVDDLKKETQLYGAEYEPIDYGQQVYTTRGDQIMHYGQSQQPQQYTQHI